MKDTTNQQQNQTSQRGDMKNHVNALTVKLNDSLYTELIKAASEATDEAEPLSIEQYASEIIESYMAERRLHQADVFIDAFIDSTMPIVESLMGGLA